MEDTRDLGLEETAHSLATGASTSVDRVRRSLDAIDASQPGLNAFRVVRREAALAEAAEADRRLAAGERLPLLGVPIAVKDDVDVTGEPTAFGCAGEFPAKTADSEVVRRLRAAGAVIVGKTNSPELGQWPFTGAASGTQGTRGRASGPPADPPAAARPRSRPGWCLPRSARTARVRSASRRRGQTWSASSRSAAGSPPGPSPRPSTASP
ncbi:amidase family protein [Rhodococcus sp. MTM3W5.2]|nr:amidase family protein [Rhodococcus sp. MTM3W5.2]